MGEPESPGSARRREELEQRLAESDAQIAALKDTVARLSHEASPRSRAAPAAARSTSPRPFSKMPAGLPSPGAASPRARSPRRAGSPRLGSPRAMSPRAGSPVAFGSTVGSRKKPMDPASFFTASMRGGPLTDPLPQRGLTRKERDYPERFCKGPSLLTRDKYGAPKSEWVKFRDFDPSNPGGGSALEDDNPFNDPFKYHPFKGMAFPPSDYIGPDDARERDDLLTLQPANALRLRFVHGYTTRKGSRSNLFYNKQGMLVYHAAALGIVYDKKNHQQWFFRGHDDDITALDLSPKDRQTVVTGQMGKDPKILVWTSKPQGDTRTLQQLCVIHGDHKRAIIGLSFNSTGEYIASMGYDNNRSIAIYKWKKDQSLEKMRIGVDKGHSDDVYQLAYNPVTDHIVAGGKKFLRFFGLKEGALDDPEAAARAAAKAGGSHQPTLAENESKIWAKKGTFGAERGAQDVMAIAFDHEGVSYAGSADGFIYRFAEQATDMSVKAHPLPDGSTNYPPKNLCRVTALHYDQAKQNLISSGDDGFIHLWDTATWGGGLDQHLMPLKSFNLNDWVVPQLKGTIVKMDDKELDKENPVRGKPAAAHAIATDGNGNVVVGTVCNEIYEFSFDAAGVEPMCLMQGHYGEMWGLAAHPSKPEVVTGAEDETLRVWNLETLSLQGMARLDGPIHCVTYSPDGEWIAVGLGGSHGPLARHKSNGKWVVLSAKSLSLVGKDDGSSLLHAPPHTRFERVTDIRFSPDSHWIAVANGDNGIDVYSVPGVGNEHTSFKRVAKWEGHSSFVAHIDWSADSTMLASNCGAHELLYWRLFDDDGRFKPRQEKSSSAMRDVEWATQTCIYGWPIRGIWPEGADGTDINACARNNTGNRELFATSDDFGLVKLFRYPCIVPYADHKPYGGHSSHVTNVYFSHDDKWLITAGGDDQAVFQWELTTEGN